MVQVEEIEEAKLTEERQALLRGGDSTPFVQVSYGRQTIIGYGLSLYRRGMAMGDKSAIEWTDATWNWATGCRKISPGCDHCYMFRLYPRLKMMGNKRYTATPDTVIVHEDLFDLPLRWSEPRMIFTCSMSDFFNERISDQHRDQALATIRKTPHHIYQILTKRSWLMKRYGDRIGGFPDNVWLGVSVEDARFKFRMDHLRETQAKTRFVSIEPLIGPVGELNLSGIHWIIVGGESGPDYRVCKIEWIRDIRKQCLRLKVPLFFKQWGGLKPKSGGRLLDGREWNQFPPHRPAMPPLTIMA